MTKTVLITGSTVGIGKATALELAKMGWHVILHGRKASTCKQVVNELILESKNERIDYCACDLSDLDAVAQMAIEIKSRFPSINVLINNAGTFSHKQKITQEGLEITWVVNYLSRFLLTNLLLDILKQNTPSRIIDVSGAYHSKGEINFGDNNLNSDYSMAKANNQSKLANILFTYQLVEKLKGTNVTINSLHPGAVKTGSVLKSNGFSSFTKLMYRMMSVFFKTPKQGAETSVYLAASKEIEGVSGKYFINKKQKKSSNATYDRSLQEKLWNFSQELVSKRINNQPI